MANIIDFEIQFREAQNSLRNLRKQLQGQLGRLAVDLDFDTKALNKLLKGSPNQLLGASGPIKSGILDKLEAELAKTTGKLEESRAKQVTLQQKMTSATGRQLAGFRLNLQKQQNAEAVLVQKYLLLTGTIDNVADSMEAAGVVFNRGVKAIDFKILQREAQQLRDTLAKKKEEFAQSEVKRLGGKKGAGPSIADIIPDPIGIKDKGLDAATRILKKQFAALGGAFAEFGDLLAPSIAKTLIQAENLYVASLRNAAKALDSQTKKRLSDVVKDATALTNRQASNFAKGLGKSHGREKEGVLDTDGLVARLKSQFDIKSLDRLQALTDLYVSSFESASKKRLAAENQLANQAQKEANKSSKKIDDTRSARVVEAERIAAETASRQAKANRLREQRAKERARQEAQASKDYKESQKVRNDRVREAVKIAEETAREQAAAEKVAVKEFKNNSKLRNDRVREAVRIQEENLKLAQKEADKRNKAINSIREERVDEAAKIDREHSARMDKANRLREARARERQKEEDKRLQLAREITAIEEAGARKLRARLQRLGSASGASEAPSSPEVSPSSTSNKFISGILNPLRAVANNVSGALDSLAKRAASSVPEGLKEAGDFYRNKLKEVGQEVTGVSREAKELSRRQAELGEKLYRATRTREALRDPRALGAPNSNRRKLAEAAAKHLGKQEELRLLIEREAQLTAEINKLTKQRTSNAQKLEGVQSKQHKLLDEQARIQEQINKFKLHEARAVQENVTRAQQAGQRGLRGFIRQFAGGAGGSPPSQPPSGGPPANSGGSGGNGGGGPGDFNKRIVLGNSLMQRFIGNLGLGDEAAFRFGSTIRRAAENLAAWAAPSILVFKTVGLLQDAVGKVTDLDTQVRRLVFFQATNTSGGLAAFNEQMQSVGNVTKEVQSNFSALFTEAQRVGIAVEKIAEAANTVSRIGQVAFLPDGAPSELLKAVEGLVKIEGGALSAERAAELLTAITQQMNLSFDDSQVLASKLAAAAADASFSLEGMGSVVARFAAAAQDVQGLTLDQVFALASEASKRFGLNASRAGTSLKNLTTLIVERRKEIEELTGISIDVGETGQLRGKEALFETLEAIKQLQGTAAGFKLGKLLGDRQNISDIFNLAGAVGSLRKTFAELEDETFLKGKATDELNAFLNQQDNISQGVQASFDRLNNSIQSLAQNSGLVEFIARLADKFTGVIEKTTELVSGADNVGNAFTTLGAIATVVLANIAKKSALAGIGFFTNKVGEQLRKDVEKGLNVPFKSAAPVQKLQDAGIIDSKTANQFITQGNSLTEKRITLETQLATQQRIADKLSKSSVATLHQQVLVRQKINALESQHKNVLLQEFLLREKIAKSTGRLGQITNSIKNNAGTLISSAAGLGLVFGDTIARSLADALGSSQSKQLVSKSLSTIFTGTAIGAELGSLFGPKGAIVGTIIGAAASGIKTLVDNVAALFGAIPQEIQKKLDESRKRAKQQQERNTLASRAADVSLAQIEQRRRVLEATALLLNKKEFERRSILLDIAKLEQEVAKIKANGGDTTKKEAEIREKANQARILQNQLAVDAKKAEAETTKEFERQYALIQAISQRQQAAASIAKIAQSAGVRDEGFLLKQDALFDKSAIASEIESIEREIDTRRRQIRSIADDPNRQDEASQLEIKNNQESERIINLRFKAVEREAQLIKDTYNLAEKRFNNQIEQQKRIVGELRDAFSNLISAQERIVSLTRDNASINTRIAQVNRDKFVDVELPGRSIADRQGALQNRLSDNRNFAEEIRRQIDQTETDRLASRSIINAGVPQFGGIEEEVNLLKERIRNVTSELEGVDGKFSADSAARREILNQDIQSFKDKIEAEKRLLTVERDSLNTRVSLNNELIASERERIDIEKQQIDIIRERAAKEAGLGENILRNPQAVVQDILNAQTARNFFGKSFKVEDIANKINSERGKAGGGARLVKVLDGLESLQRLGVQNVNGRSVEELKEIFLRLQGNSAGKVQSSIDEEYAARARVVESVDNIVAANNDIIGSLERLKGANEEQVNLENRLRELEQARIDVLEVQNNDIQAKLPQIFDNFEQASIAMRDSMGQFSGIINETNENVARLSRNFGTLDEEIAALINVLRSDREQGRIIFDAGRPQKGNTKSSKGKGSGGDASIADFAAVIGETMTRAVASFEEKLNNATVRVEADIPAMEVQLNATIQNVINGDEFLAKLTEELKGTGLEDRVEQIRQIVLQLVAVERTRGTRLPPTF